MKSGKCIPWGGSTLPNRYGRVYISPGKYKLAHRMAYEGCYGKIPEDMVLDHICRNPSCINPNHLRVVTNKENVLCGVGITAMNARKANCGKCGNPFDEVRKTMRKGKPRYFRSCRSCRLATALSWWKRIGKKRVETV